MSIRPVKHVSQSKPTIEGAGVHLRRAFGFGNTTDFDPFLLFDDFRQPTTRTSILPAFPGTLIAASDDHICVERSGRSRGQSGE